MTNGRFILELRSDELDEQGVHEALQAIKDKKLTARFLSDIDEIKEPSLSTAMDGSYANADETQREEFLKDLRTAVAQLPYLKVISATASHDVPYMVQMNVQLARIGAMVDAVKADLDNVLDAHAIRGRKTARLARDTPEGFEVMMAMMDSGYFVTARISVELGEKRR